MKKLELCFKVLQWACLSFAAAGILLLCVVNLFVACKANPVERDYAYEAFCDSIWENNPDYYYDVLAETDSFQQYVEEVGQWWEEETTLKDANDFKRELLDAHEKCASRAEHLMLMNDIHDNEYDRLKSIVDSLYSTQL